MNILELLGEVDTVRQQHEQVRRRPRRSCCLGCSAPRVLLPVSCLARRADDVVVIGSGLLASALLWSRRQPVWGTG